jgi:hypothetical protein
VSLSCDEELDGTCGLKLTCRSRRHAVSGWLLGGESLDDGKDQGADHFALDRADQAAGGIGHGRGVLIRVLHCL